MFMIIHYDIHIKCMKEKLLRKLNLSIGRVCISLRLRNDTQSFGDGCLGLNNIEKLKWVRDVPYSSKIY